MTENMVVMTEELEKLLKKEFGEKATPEFVNLVRVAVAAHEHAFQGFITKEKFLEWVSQAWDAGESQRITDEKEVDSSIYNGIGLVLASALRLVSKKPSYLAKSKK